MQYELEVSGMTCNHCRARVSKALAAVADVTAVTVDLASGRATVEAAHALDVATLLSAVEAQGYGAKAA